MKRSISLHLGAAALFLIWCATVLCIEEKNPPVFLKNEDPRSLILKNAYPDMSIHCLRHTFASLCYHLGISEAETMRLGGWSDINAMREIYTHLAEVDKTEAARKLKAFFSPPPERRVKKVKFE